MDLPIRLMPAAGWCKTIDHVRALVKIPTISHIVMGSFTKETREGNTGGTTFHVREDGTSFNSLGLPNGGMPYLEKHLAQMLEIAYDADKMPIVNIAADTPEEYCELARFANEAGARVVELNFGCPNKFGTGGNQKEIASYNIDLMRKTLALIRMRCSVTIWLKLSPFANPEERVRVAGLIMEMLGKYKLTELSQFGGITVCNTYPNCVPRDENGKKIIDAKNTNGRAGMAGTGLRDIALANVEHFMELLQGVPIYGAGGISTWKHLAAFSQLGCKGGQIGTAFFHGENFRIFEEVMTGFLHQYEAK